MRICADTPSGDVAASAHIHVHAVVDSVGSKTWPQHGASRSCDGHGHAEREGTRNRARGAGTAPRGRTGGRLVIADEGPTTAEVARMAAPVGNAVILTGYREAVMGQIDAG